MVRSMLSVLAGIAVLKQSSFASEAAVNPPGLRVARFGRLPVRHAIVAMLSPEGNHASRRHWIIIAILSVPAALAGRTLYKRKETR